MAEKPPKKRVLKNADSFRERALKNSAETNKKKGGIKRSFKKLGVIFRPFKKVARKLYSYKFVRIVLWPFKMILRILVPKYIRSSFKELKLVTWPTWKQSLRLTYAVIIFAVVFGAAVAGLDHVLSEVFRKILLK